jgi:hypothetical protein
MWFFNDVFVRQQVIIVEKIEALEQLLAWTEK